ncbi:MAG TPA: response regulator [Methanoregula sp.]|nr:response regulator [Methanoregula sp.]
MDQIVKKTVKILVVEDSRTQAEYLRHILETEGYRVLLAENGRDALENVTSFLPTMILTDIVMPEMDGYELCKRIRQDEKTRGIPVILVSQLFDPADVTRGLECGADDFIVKPYDPDYIRARITGILEAIGQPDPEGIPSPLDISLAGKTHHITASRLRIVRILLSTYEVAVRRNTELEEAREQLNAMNEQLHGAVDDLRQSNARLESENNERRRVEKALDEANKKLNLMASITRHDVVNQLTTQNESLEYALRLKDTDAQKAWEYVSAAAQIGTRTLNSVKFTGDYQKVGVKSPQWQDIRSLVDSAAEEKVPDNLLVKNEIPAGTEIYADPLIGKVFSNLMENSVKYGEKVTMLRVSLEKTPAGSTIICEDDGIGIPAGRKESIFTYEHGMTMGLGLFLAREILAITGITLYETGTSGSGARFEIRCPDQVVRHHDPASA